MKKRKKYPYQGHVTTTRDSQARQAFYGATDDQAPLSGRGQLAAGRVQHPDTGMYQVWLSTNGLDVTHLAAHRDQARADVALEELKAFLRTPAVYDSDKCAALFEKLQQDSDDEPQPLPDTIVHQITRGILRRVVDGPR